MDREAEAHADTLHGVKTNVALEGLCFKATSV